MFTCEPARATIFTMNEAVTRENSLPAGWVWTTLGEVAELIGGGTPKRANPKYFTGDIVWLTPTEIPKVGVTLVRDSKERITDEGLRRSSARLIPSGSVLMTSRASIGYVAVAGIDLTTNQGFASFIPNEGILNFFLAYWLRANTELFLQHATGTTFKEITKSKLRPLAFPVAPLPEQHRIVAEIETQFTRLDAGVAALKRVQANLRRYKASVLKAACEGRLVPTEAELARAKGRDYEPANALLQRILAERRARWEAENPKKKYKEPAAPDVDDMSELPEGWVWARLEQLADVAGGVTKGRNLAGKQTLALPYLRVANVQQGWLDLAEIKEIEALPSDLEKYRLHDGDLLLTEGGDRDKLGRSAIWRDWVPDCIHQNHIFRARPFTGDLLPEWLMYNTNSEQGRQYFVKHGKQTTNLASINLTQLRNFPVPVPSASEQRRIVAEVERRLSVVQEMEATVATNLKRAERLRQSILKRAFEGRLVPQDPNDEPASVL